MKTSIYSIVLLCTLLLFTGCEKYETYSDMKEKEQDAISKLISDSCFQIISESTFEAQGQATVGDKQFVRFDRNGVYMQIVRKGCGTILENKKQEQLVCRFLERNIMTGAEIYNNKRSYLTITGLGTIDVSQYLDKMNVTRNGTTITASFISGMMYQYHGSATVPGGWIVPLNYVKVGYPENEDDEIAKVRLIVPHSQGTADASSNVEPYYYEITYQRAL